MRPRNLERATRALCPMDLVVLSMALFRATVHNAPTTAHDRDPTNDVDLVALAEEVLMVENAPTPLAAVVPAGRVVLANRSLRNLLGYRAEDIRDRLVTELADVGGSCDVNAWQHLTNWRVRLRHRDGTWLDARVSTIVVADDQQAPKYLLCLVHAA